MNPIARGLFVFGKCVVCAGLAFVTYRFAAKEAISAGGEALNVFTHLMGSGPDQTLTEVVETALGVGA